MPPNAECLEDGVELLVVHVVIEFGRVEGAGMESDRMDFTVLELYGEDSR
jgi:hypothetical protein